MIGHPPHTQRKRKSYEKGRIPFAVDPLDDMRIEVIVLDYFEDIASVKVVTPHYYEYLHLATLGKQWIIVNTLYEKNRPTAD